NGNVRRDAGRQSPFYRADISLQKAFGVPGTERVRIELRADAFNVLNHSNFQGYNGNDALSALGLSATSGVPDSDFFTCNSCLRPTGHLVGSSGQVLHLSDLQRGKVSRNLLSPDRKSTRLN